MHPRRIAVTLHKEVKAKLEELEKKNILVKETEPTDWISSMVVLAKPGKIRICLDPKDLNKGIRRPKYQLPTLEEVLPKLSKAKVFTWRQGQLLPNNTRRKEQQAYNIMDALWPIPISSDAIWSQCSPRGIWMQITRTPQQPKRSRRLERRHIGLRIRWYHRGSQCRPWHQPDKATSKSTQSKPKV